MAANGKKYDSLTLASSCCDGRYHSKRHGQSYASKRTAPSGQDRVSRISGRLERRRENSESVASRGVALEAPLVARPPPRRPLDRSIIAKQCVMMAAHTQEALFEAHELDAEMKEMTLWLHAHGLPLQGRRQVLLHLEPIFSQMTFCREELLRGWKQLHPPFYQPHLDSFQRRLSLFEQSVQLLTAALKECKTNIQRIEVLAACTYIQLWTRRLLAKRGFYTQVVKLSFHHRGIVSGMFDSIKGRSKLTAHGRKQSITLEYPRLDNSWDCFSK